jgi:3-oxoacyl-(acyl-carrier-protein) synthase
MSLVIVGMGTAKSVNLGAMKAKPEFRKATLNMMLAAASQDEALAPLTLQSETLTSSMMILGSSYGELGVTIGFLEYLSQSGVARPLLFQNSLHNSTLGFLAMRLNLQGPAFTVSNGVLTGENSIELACTWLRDKKMPLCIVTCVDSIVTQLRLDDQLPIGSRGEGAGTLLLAQMETAKQYGWPILGLEASLHGHDKYDQLAANAYHSDAVERLVELLRATT